MPPRALTGRELIGVADQDDFGLRGSAGLEEAAQLGGADHGGFVDEDHGAPIDLELIVLDQLQCFGHGQAAVAGPAAHCLIDRLAGGREHQHVFVGAVRRGAQRCQ